MGWSRSLVLIRARATSSSFSPVATSLQAPSSSATRVGAAARAAVSPMQMVDRVAPASPFGAADEAAAAAAAGAARTTLSFSINDQVGALDECLAALRARGVSLTRIESRPSRTPELDYDFFIDFDATDSAFLPQALDALGSRARNVRVVSTASTSAKPNDLRQRPSASTETVTAAGRVPWFPRRLHDLDTFATKVLEMGEELDADHPGVHDQAYRQRRAEITARAKAYRTGQPLPRVPYTPEETAAWGTVYRRLRTLYPTHACREFNHLFPLLEANCDYGPDRIPQIEDVSRFLHECTGFSLRPVMGLLSSRDFLNALAFRVFFSTQYIRHPSKPLYTPEPDVCHELLGHAPLFANPEFAAFAQEIGLASLGASDEDVKQLATIFWFTVEYGMCHQDTHHADGTVTRGELKAFGAGLLSSFGELEYCLTNQPEHRPFDPARTAVQTYPVTEYQPVYFVAESFRDAKEKVREFAKSLRRPFDVRYDPYSQTVQVLDSREKILQYAQTISADMQVLTHALEVLEAPH
ncbi:hypothetical protein IWQ60_008658 [Tieghemiomyces parasiticus]|uniref:phenylalanine 4-monooxygenase n=1 Tax=Tieghemiomyces parasiticus TaxID=78921 RepID=A0A9W7ZZ72_9FUNG|nr:hypothetical protein IWQ60_008658 [Tieghemiomyces parasiticus]